ncbi:unnamed protein product [Arabidopsis lyrata]|uniref:Predicted protein n=1 Tax=Arabidopsis lyrata subsp. lyrata TaxID=81972 RepID=D7KJB7_ARALL|nr:predicted protein [Arabidopsis lyrata subsp. lyrata]CAH8254192.1 unnamed protein product [Arabidopsis lyrata]
MKKRGRLAGEDDSTKTQNPVTKKKRGLTGEDDLPKTRSPEKRRRGIFLPFRVLLQEERK